jgi:hypothetical protein
MKTIAEQIRDLEATRAAKAARMTEVVQKSLEEGRSTDEGEQEEFDTLDSEIKQIDGDLVRLKRLESLAVQKGRTVVTPEPGSEPAASQQRGGPTIIVRSTKDAEDKFAGQGFVRKLIAKAVAIDEAKELGHPGRSPGQIAESRWGKTNPTLVQVIKAGVAGGGSGSGEWGAELVSADNRYTGDFIEYLYGKTLFDMLGLREVPANVTIKGQDGTATANWVGESKSIPVSAQDYLTVSLTPLKVAAISVASKELLADSSPSAEMLIRDSLVNASAQKVDGTFFSTAALSAGVSPAGILNGIPGYNSYGPTQEGVIGDIKRLVGIFQTAKNASGLVIVTTPSLATSLGLMLTSLGQDAFPGLTGEGGVLRGMRVMTGDNVPAGAFIMLKPSDIYRIGDMGVSVQVSDVATIEQDNAPQGASDTPTAASATIMSMFGTESVAFKVVRRVNFAKRRSHAVQYVDNADYGATDTST